MCGKKRQKKGTYLFYSAFTACTSCRGRMNALVMSIVNRTQRSEQTAGLLKTTVGSKRTEEGLGV
jgi:hypothetical protein